MSSHNCRRILENFHVNKIVCLELYNSGPTVGGFILSVFLRVLYQNYVANWQQTLFKHS